MDEKILERMEILQGDITRLQVDAIVNAANSSLLGGGGVDGAIHRAAGPRLLEECRGIGGCPTGEARITGGYDLPASYVIHTVGPIYGDRPEDPVHLASCYRNSLQLAIENGIETIAFPAISCGVYGYPLEAASRIAVTAVSEALAANATLKRVTFVLFSDEDFAVYRKLLSTSP